MSHTPFGYRIENGKAVIDKEAAEQIKTLFQSYLSGDSLATAAKKAGIKAFHSGIGRMLRNTRYLGDEFYPSIIDKDTFNTAEAEPNYAGGKTRVQKVQTSKGGRLSYHLPHERRNQRNSTTHSGRRNTPTV